MEELLQRILKNLDSIKIAMQKVKDALKNWQKILADYGPMYQVFEWKDDVIHIQDNLFLFLLRWSSI